MEQKSIDQFVQAIRDLEQTKYILVDKKITELLKVIQKNKDVYNYIIECLINFNFERTLKGCTATGNFVLPDKDHILVAFIYELLVRFDSKKINITDFISKFFSNNFDNIDGFEYFCLAVLNRFERVVANNLLGIKERKTIKINKIVGFDAEITKRVKFLLESLKISSLKNDSMSEERMKDFISVMLGVLKSKQYEEFELLLNILYEVKFKVKLNGQIIKELQQILGSYGR